MTKQPILFLEDGSEITLPTRWEICGCCEGSGKSSAYLGAFTRDDMDEAGQEFMDDYMAGHYDRACDPCGGTGKVPVVDRAKLTPEYKVEWDAQCRADAECAAIERAERAMGA